MGQKNDDEESDMSAEFNLSEFHPIPYSSFPLPGVAFRCIVSHFDRCFRGYYSWVCRGCRAVKQKTRGKKRSGVRGREKGGGSIDKNEKGVQQILLSRPRPIPRRSIS